MQTCVYICMVPQSWLEKPLNCSWIKRIRFPYIYSLIYKVKKFNDLDCFYENWDCTEISIFSSCLSLSLVDYLRCPPLIGCSKWTLEKIFQLQSLEAIERNATSSFQNNIFELSRVSEPLLGSQAVLLSQHILKMFVFYWISLKNTAIVGSVNFWTRIRNFFSII